MSTRPEGSKESSIRNAPSDVLSTLSQDGKRRWLYPILSPGRFWRSRAAVGWSLIALFTLLPIVKINGKPAVFMDLAHTEFTFFGLTLYTTDTVLSMIFLLSVLISLFFATALLGRVWCGWGCPQTVYLEFVYRPIERLLEGTEAQRKRRDEGPWNVDKAWRKALKFSIYLVISLALAHTFVAYFVSWERLILWMQRPPKENWSFFLMMSVTTGLILFDFSVFREQMCTIACPYARLQSVLVDGDSMIVSYDAGRGEKRGRRTREQRKQEAEGVYLNLGDCIDCGACVRTCPTGIDIRNGLQMECIGCTQCMDACDAIMIGVKKPVGLIRYTSENILAGGKPKPVRLRTVLYGVLWLILVGAFITLVSVRTTLDVNIGRVVNVPFIEMGDGIANNLRFRVQNRQSGTTAEIVAVSPPGTEVRVIGESPLPLPQGEHVRVETFVIVPREAFVDGSAKGEFEVRTSDGRVQRAKFHLLGPSLGAGVTP